jgi:hypothetical protein
MQSKFQLILFIIFSNIKYYELFLIQNLIKYI